MSELSDPYQRVSAHPHCLWCRRRNECHSAIMADQFCLQISRLTMW